MIILGIDPGTKRVGYGVIEKNGPKLTLLEAGLLKIGSNDAQKIIQEIKHEMDALILRTKPDIAGIEKLFFAKNQKTALSVAHARGVIILSLKEHDIPTSEYGPSEIKSSVTGYGMADKKAVFKMVRFFLNQPSLRLIDDASDALAIAITTAARAVIQKGG